MQREIKFRGKRVDKGEWVYGTPMFCTYDDDGIEHYAAIVIREHNPTTGFRAHEIINVMPETVGQYTGLKDKNGNEIYEGDIVYAEVSAFGKFNHAVCRFTNGSFSFYKPDGTMVLSVDTDMYKIVGSIHENPELLKTKEQ